MAGSSDNTRMDQLENNMNMMAEQLQAIANAVAAGQNGGTGGNGMRQEGLDARTTEEILSWMMTWLSMLQEGQPARRLSFRN